MGNDPTSTRSRNAKQAQRKVRPLATWSWLSAEALQQLLMRCQECDIALMFSRTADGHSLGLKMYRGDDNIKKYAQDPTELLYIMMDMFDAYGEAYPAFLEAWASGSD